MQTQGARVDNLPDELALPEGAQAGLWAAAGPGGGGAVHVFRYGGGEGITTAGEGVHCICNNQMIGMPIHLINTSEASCTNLVSKPGIRIYTPICVDTPWDWLVLLRQGWLCWAFTAQLSMG